MRIAFFTDSYYPQLNGVTISVENFVLELRKQGHTVYIFAPQMKRTKKGTDENIINLPSLKVLSSDPAILFPLPTSYKNYKQLFNLDLDLVHAHGNGPFSLLGYQVAKMKQIPFILTFHSMFSKYTHYFFNGKVVKPKAIETYMRIFANICDAVTTPSEKMKKELLLYGVKKYITVIPNFVDPKPFQNVNKNFLHEKFDIPSHEPLLVTVGRIGIEKNFPFLVHMFKVLTKTDKTSHLIIVGDGPEKKHLQQLIHKLDLEKRVHFAGKVSMTKMPLVYADATVFVFSSETEVHPMVTLEAIAAGLPLVVGHDEAFDGVVVNNHNGFRLPLDEKIFAEKIQKLLKDKKLYQKFSTNSQAISDTQFAPQQVTNNLVTLYKKTLADQKKKSKPLDGLNRQAILQLRKTARLFNRIFTT